MNSLLRTSPVNPGTSGVGISFHQQGICVGYPRSEHDAEGDTFPWQAEFFAARGALGAKQPQWED